MATIKRFEDLEIWIEARRLSLCIFEITQKETFSREYKFKDQIKASAGSVMDNIAEGFERSGRLEFVNFLGFAKGSAGEVRSQCYRAFDQGYITQDEFDDLYSGYEKLASNIAGFINYLNRSAIKGQKFKDRI